MGNCPRQSSRPSACLLTAHHPDAASYLVTQCGHVQCCREELHARKRLFIIALGEGLPVAYKSWGKIIPLEISLQQVTRYLKMFKRQKYLVNLEIKQLLWIKEWAPESISGCSIYGCLTLENLFSTVCLSLLLQKLEIMFISTSLSC